MLISNTTENATINGFGRSADEESTIQDSFVVGTANAENVVGFIHETEGTVANCYSALWENEDVSFSDSNSLTAVFTDNYYMRLHETDEDTHATAKTAEEMKELKTTIIETFPYQEELTDYPFQSDIPFYGNWQEINVLPKYTITFMLDEPLEYTESELDLSTITAEREGYELVGWQTDAFDLDAMSYTETVYTYDGTTISEIEVTYQYKPDDVLIPTENMTLMPVWSYIINENNNDSNEENEEENNDENLNNNEENENNENNENIETDQNNENENIQNEENQNQDNQPAENQENQNQNNTDNNDDLNLNEQENTQQNEGEEIPGTPPEENITG